MQVIFDFFRAYSKGPDPYLRVHWRIYYDGGSTKRLSMDCEIEMDLITLCNQKQIQALQRLIGALFYNKSLVHVRARERKMKFH